MKKRGYSVVLAILLTAAVFVLPIVNAGKQPANENSDSIRRVSSILDRNNRKDQTAPAKVNIPKSDATAVFVVTVKGDSLADTVQKSKLKYKNVYELIRSGNARKTIDNIKKNQAVVKATIEKMITGASFANSYTYNTVLNGFTVSAPYSSLDKIRGISGVLSVSPVFSSSMTISENEAEQDMESPLSDISQPEQSDMQESNGNTEESVQQGPSEKIADVSEPVEEPDQSPAYQKMIGVSDVRKAGFEGNGKAIAFIDDSFDCANRLFMGTPPTNRYTKDDITRTMSSQITEAGKTADVYKSNKIVFAYDYAEHDSNTFSPASDHGTKCAAAAAGCTLEDESSFRGVAADAQLLFMKVCKNGANDTSDDVLLAALDDIAKLAPDVLNISMGVYGTATNAALFDYAYEIISSMGTLITAAAGNGRENVVTHTDEGIRAEYTDYGSLTYPSYLPEILSAAACETDECIYNYLETNDGQVFPYCDIVSSGTEEIPSFSDQTEELSYICPDVYGTKEDYSGVDAAGKIVILNRGDNTLTEKLKIALTVNAAGVLLISDEPLYIRFSAEEGLIPAGCIAADAGAYFEEHPAGTIHFQKDGVFSNANGGKPSTFTSYGVTSDLRLKPDLSAPGTEIRLPVADEEETCSGSSVSSAVISGAAAVLSQYIDSSLSGVTDKNMIISALLMNTAQPSLYDSDVYYTPRLQGAGNLQLEKALHAAACITDENGRPSVSMGDSEQGTFQFSLVLRNMTEESVQYHLRTALQSDRLTNVNGQVLNTLTPQSILGQAEITYQIDGKAVDRIDAAPLEEVQLDCSVNLTPELLMYAKTYAVNGMYIDGFVFFEPEGEGTELSVPFTGYCGSWEDADIFDVSDYQTVKESAVGRNSLYACMVDNSDFKSAEIGINHFTGKTTDQTIAIGRNTINNLYDLTSSAVPFIIPDFYLLRNAADFTITIREQGGKVLFTQNLGTVSSFAGGNEPYADLISTFNTDNLSNLFASLAEGTYVYQVSARTIGFEGGQGTLQTVEYTFVIDNTPPEQPETEIYTKDGRVYLKLQAKDTSGIQGFILYTAGMNGGTMNYSDRLDALMENEYIPKDAYELVSGNCSGESAEFVYDITNLYYALMGLTEYAGNNGMSVPVTTSIFVKSADAAFNLSQPVSCGTIVPSEVTYSVKDGEGNPVEGVTIELAGKMITSDRQGQIHFEEIVPDIYAAKLVQLPEDYESNTLLPLVEISNSDYKKEFTVLLEYTGEAVESSLEEMESSIQESEPEVQQPSFESDDSVFALAFIGMMLMITSVSLLLSRKKKTSFRWQEEAEEDHLE